MAKFQKKEKENKGNVIADPEIRKKFKSALSTVTHYFQQSDDAKEGAKETIEALSDEYGIEKKLVRKLATVMYKSNYGSRVQEENHFQHLYEIVVMGGSPGDPPSGDPLDA